MGSRILNCQAIIGVLTFGSQTLPQPLSELAKRDELTTWLTRVFFNTLIHGESLPSPQNIRLPHTLVAFFGVIMHLHRVGYPGHWLSEFLGRILGGEFVSDIVPYDGVYPIPVSHRARRVQQRRVRTDPWLVELENIIATAYYAIPFPVTLPASLTRDPGDIVMWQVHVVEEPFISDRLAQAGKSIYDPRTHLLFYRSDLSTATSITTNIRTIFEGKQTPPPGTFFILTAQEHVQYQTSIRFRLSKTRVEAMRKERLWSMVAYRNDTGALGESNVLLTVRPTNARLLTLFLLYANRDTSGTYSHMGHGFGGVLAIF